MNVLATRGRDVPEVPLLISPSRHESIPIEVKPGLHDVSHIVGVIRIMLIHKLLKSLVKDRIAWGSHKVDPEAVELRGIGWKYFHAGEASICKDNSSLDPLFITR